MDPLGAKEGWAIRTDRPHDQLKGLGLARSRTSAAGRLGGAGVWAVVTDGWLVVTGCAPRRGRTGPDEWVEWVVDPRRDRYAASRWVQGERVRRVERSGSRRGRVGPASPGRRIDPRLGAAVLVFVAAVGFRAALGWRHRSARPSPLPPVRATGCAAIRNCPACVACDRADARSDCGILRNGCAADPECARIAACVGGCAPGVVATARGWALDGECRRTCGGSNDASARALFEAQLRCSYDRSRCPACAASDLPEL